MNINKETLKKKKAILKRILTQINKGGVTYNFLLDKDYAGTRHVSVNPLLERSQTFPGKATAEMITNYCDANSDLFKKYKKLALGSWYDETIRRTWLDIAIPIPLEKMPEAIALARKANQKAVFNLFTFTETQLGGTGLYDPLIVTTTFEERLKEALMLMGEEGNNEDEQVDYTEELESIPEKDNDGIDIKNIFEELSSQLAILK